MFGDRCGCVAKKGTRKEGAEEKKGVEEQAREKNTWIYNE